MPELPFKPPLRIREHSESFEIYDASGLGGVFVYFEDEPVRRNMTGRRAHVEALALARFIARIATDHATIENVQKPNSPANGASTGSVNAASANSKLD